MPLNKKLKQNISSLCLSLHRSLSLSLYIYIYIYKTSDKNSSTVTLFWTFLLWSRGGWNDDTTQECGIRNILIQNSTYIKDSWRETPPQLNTIMNITVLGDGSLSLRRRELSRYMSHQGMSICRVDIFPYPLGHSTRSSFHRMAFFQVKTEFYCVSFF